MTIDNKIFERPFMVYTTISFILLSLISYTLNTVDGLPVWLTLSLQITEYVVVVAFTIEYLMRIFLANRKLSYIFSFYGLIDLIAIAPFYLTLAMDLQTLRVLRIFLILRVLKLTRYNAAVKRIKLAITGVKDELILYTIASLILIYLASVGIYHFEHAAQPDVFKNLFDCLWWAVATLTTVGYGEIYPITNGGRFFTFIVLIAGLGLVAVPTGLLASSLSSVRNKKSK